ncbi:hypothetical protein [Micromonospora sp. S4605]|uniref:hypothetical protein n=1 Tax=Micromonospora sp. S4605 TaxID=1420897 RepID=UPI001305488B|nr:hypothetical protein [Micromonospora sp. S4605]
MSDRGAAAKASDPRLDSLAPKVDKEEHGVYVTILKRAIDEQTDVRNIALTGTYPGST